VKIQKLLKINVTWLEKGLKLISTYTVHTSFCFKEVNLAFKYESLKRQFLYETAILFVCGYVLCIKACSKL